MCIRDRPHTAMRLQLMSACLGICIGIPYSCAPACIGTPTASCNRIDKIGASRFKTKNGIHLLGQIRRTDWIPVRHGGDDDDLQLYRSELSDEDHDSDEEEREAVGQPAEPYLSDDGSRSDDSQKLTVDNIYGVEQQENKISLLTVSVVCRCCSPLCSTQLDEARG